MASKLQWYVAPVVVQGGGNPGGGGDGDPGGGGTDPGGGSTDLAPLGTISSKTWFSGQTNGTINAADFFVNNAGATYSNPDDSFPTGVTINAATGVITPAPIATQGSTTATVRAEKNGETADQMFTFSVIEAPVAGAIEWGWNPDEDLGTAGDWYVSAAVGVSGNGLTPATAKKTVTEARNLASSGQVIKVIGDGVKYRETVFGKNGLTIEGYGSDKPIITAAESMSGGWEQITQNIGDDAQRIGSALALSGNVWVWKNFDMELIAHTREGPRATSPSPRAMNIHENGERCLNCMYWEGQDLNDKYFSSRVQDWWDAESVGRNGSKIVSYTDPRVFAAMSDLQIMNCYFRGHCSNNTSFSTSIPSVDRSSNTWFVADTSRTYETSAKKNRYAMSNALPFLEEGQWGYWENGDETVDVYLWPRNPSAINDDSIEFSARTTVLDVNAVANVALRGVELRQSAGVGSNEGSLVLDFQSNNNTSGLAFEHCRFFGGNGESAIALSYADNLTIRRCSFYEVPSGWSHLGGDSPALTIGEIPEDTVFSTGNLIEQNHIRRCGSGSRNWTQAFCVIAHNRCEMMGLSAHANKQYCYEQNHNVLYWGNTYEDCDGYATWQEACAVYTAFCYITATRAGLPATNTSRCIQDQNNGTTPPCNWTTPTANQPVVPPPGSMDASILFNNACIPLAEVIAAGNFASNAMTLGKTDEANSNVTYEVINNLMHGISFGNKDQVVLFRNNYLTADGTNHASDVLVTPTGVWTDPANGDFSVRTTGEGAILRAATGFDLTSRINALKAKFPRFANWDYDAAGDVFDPASPPIGCFVNFDNYFVYRNKII